MNTDINLFSPYQIGNLELPNRIVMAPLTRNRAGEGNVPHQLNATYYAQRASAGLIIAEATQVVSSRTRVSLYTRNSFTRTGRGLEIGD